VVSQDRLIEIEREYYRNGFVRIAGLDEAGRGPLAGPVLAAAAVFDPFDLIEGIDDSKKLAEKRREELFEVIMERALDIGVGISWQEEIDEINILAATRLAMQRAIRNLKSKPDCLLIDGLFLHDVQTFQDAIQGGDSKCRCIAGASIVAKVVRDRIMRAFDSMYPGYGFSKNKGYPTQEHLKAIGELGILPIHRKSYAPVRRVIENMALPERA
jgi:ribonuclease HII